MATYYWYTTRDASQIKPGWRVPPRDIRNMPHIQMIAENIFEEVRRKHYSGKPSRLTNIFVCPKYPSEFCDPHDTSKTIFEVEAKGKTFGANADYYAHGINAAVDLKYNMGDPEELKEQIREAAHNYWGRRGVQMTNEVIVDGTVTIVGPATKKIASKERNVHTMNDDLLRKLTIRLAHNNRDLRPHLLPLLKEALSRNIPRKEEALFLSLKGDIPKNNPNYDPKNPRTKKKIKLKSLRSIKGPNAERAKQEYFKEYDKFVKSLKKRDVEKEFSGKKPKGPKTLQPKEPAPAKMKGKRAPTKKELEFGGIGKFKPPKAKKTKKKAQIIESLDKIEQRMDNLSAKLASLIR